jgi:arylsulfatase A-like enzyme
MARGFRGARLVLAAVLVAAACLLTVCHRPSQPNILIIMIDTLRADRVGWYGDGRQVTPFLDSLAEHGTVFWSAYAQSSWTCPSIASLLTSRYPSQHNVLRHASVLTPGELTLAEVLKKHGYATGAFVANRVLPTRLGYNQGFDTYQVFPSELPESEAEDLHKLLQKGRGEALQQASLAWLDRLQAGQQAAQPVLLYMHYMEVHFPYAPPLRIVEQVSNRRHHGSPGGHIAPQPVAAAPPPPNPDIWPHPDADALAALEDKYDAEVLTLDTLLHEFFAQLDRRGFLNHAVVVVLADHGEEFLDHGGMNHGSTLYNELIRVPLLVVVPGQTRRVDIPDVVSVIDVAPTLLDLAGIAPPPTFAGRSLRWTTGWATRLLNRGRNWLGMGRDGQVAFSELLEPLDPTRSERHPDQALIAGSRKLITTVDGGTAVYDLNTDPGERKPAVLLDPDPTGLRRRLQQVREHAHSNPAPQETRALDEQTRERLRALGYDAPR